VPPSKSPRLKHVWVDQGSTGTAWIEEQLGWTVEVVQQAPKPRGVWAFPGQVLDGEALRPKGCRGVLQRRWVAERTRSRLGHSAVSAKTTRVLATPAKR
jgi:transposase